MEAKRNYLFIENYWSVFWIKNKRGYGFKSKGSSFALDMFPYPSNKGLHVGHPVGYIFSDILHKYSESTWLSSLRVMGWDSFGLPTEQYSIITKTHPAISTKINIRNFKKQLNRCAVYFDWSKSFKTTDKDFYKWTQYLFLVLLKGGFCYSKSSSILWCPKLNTVLAHEEVDNHGLSERGGHPTNYKFLNQWVLKLKSYSLSYIRNLNFLEWPSQTKNMQFNWIGVYKNYRTYVATPDKRYFMKVLITKKNPRAFLFIKKLKVSVLFFYRLSNLMYLKKVKRFLQKIKLTLNKNVCFKLLDMGVLCSLDYKLSNITIVKSSGLGGSLYPYLNNFKTIFMGKGLLFFYTKNLSNYTYINSLQYDYTNIKTLNFNHQKGFFTKDRFKLKVKDWVFSRQRYWGEPFPVIWVEGATYNTLLKNIVHTRSIFKNNPPLPIWKKKGSLFLICLPLLLKNLPVKLKPYSKKNVQLRYFDTRKGSFKINFKRKEFLSLKFGLKITCLMDSNVMPQWAGSSWYYLKYVDSIHKNRFLSKGNIKSWGTPSTYVGGSEHAVLHLLYSRFWSFVLHEQKEVFFREPFKTLQHQGLILTEVYTHNKYLRLCKKNFKNVGVRGFINKNLKRCVNLLFKKMSKSSGVSLNPLKIINRFGVDSFRVYEMLSRTLSEYKVWSTLKLIEVFLSIKNIYTCVLKNKFFNIKNSLKFYNVKITLLNVHEVLNKTLRTVLCKYNLHLVLSFVRLTYLYIPNISEEVWLRLGFKKNIGLVYETIKEVSVYNYKTKGRVVLNYYSMYANTLYFKKVKGFSTISKTKTLYFFKVKGVCVHASSRNRTNNINLED